MPEISMNDIQIEIFETFDAVVAYTDIMLKSGYELVQIIPDGDDGYFVEMEKAIEEEEE